MSCDEVRELLPAFTLGLLDSDETAAVEAHLRGCRDHDEELMELRATSFALDLLRDDIEPALSLEAGVRRTAAMKPPARQAPSTPRWWLAAAAVVALFAVFGGGWAAHAYLDDPDSPPAAPAGVRYSYALQGADGALVRLSGLEGSDRVTVTMSGLPQLADGRLYRLWAIRGGLWVRIGQCDMDEGGGWVGDFPFSLAADEQLAVTIEAPSADPQPRGVPILRTGS